ncbi:DUF262 domain-containing protein [Lysobacter sp. BMK333-48F3]|uniref:DUF262 domain-containing protein n=1 Tax=Lysobacter sp. BMK333-48F3 TaxID=2867962 RepID=UPI001C8B1A20|nr:DUF262 domain-containing protein [Lysobacter sp. BMK333-48F3]MBX9401495.1 DUF262 domain-containing protein [Lysobacter sp. BMK333-48F3]
MNDVSSQVPEITPQVVHLVDLLKRAKEGRLRVPRFQREYVWRRQDIVDLFDSVVRQYPIGTLFLWGAQPVPNSRENIGPLFLPKHEGEVLLVLDGQQRLTTLVGVLLADEAQWDASGDQDPGRWVLYFDAKSSGFSHAAAGEVPPIYYIPVSTLLDTVKLFAQVEIMLKSEAARDDVFDWVNKAQEVARAIQGYRIPLVEIKTNNLSVAVESFSRLNKKGRSIGQDEMFSALTYTENAASPFHLAVEIDGLQAEMVRSGFGAVDRNVLLRAVLTAANLDMYRTDWTRLGDQVKDDVRGGLPQAIDEAQKGLDLARKFLASVGVYNERMLPYSMQLVALSAFYGRCEKPTEEQVALLVRWFWSSSFAGWFGSGNPARVRRLVDEFRDRISKDPAPLVLENMDIAQHALPTPSRFDLRSARVRALLCVLFGMNPLRPDGKPLGAVGAGELLLNRGPEAMNTLCATVSDSELRTGPANRIIDVYLEGAGQAKNWVLNLADEIRGAVLLSHCIPLDAFDLLRENNNNEFLQRRMHAMIDLEVEFMKKVSVTPPASRTPALPPVDADDF